MSSLNCPKDVAVLAILYILHNKKEVKTNHIETGTTALTGLGGAVKKIAKEFYTF